MNLTLVGINKIDVSMLSSTSKAHLVIFEH